MVSGLKINFAKSEIFKVGEVVDIQVLASTLGCKINSLPATYLGLPLEAKFKSSLVWEPMVERIRHRLEFWKAPLLSKGGCLVLIKSSLASILNFFLSMFTIPGYMANLWNNETNKHRKHYLVDWKSICPRFMLRAWAFVVLDCIIRSY